MKTDNWIPGHSLNKGYPYNGAESSRMMKSRPTLTMNEDSKIEIIVHMNLFTGLTEEDVNKQRTAFEDFLLHRLYDFQETLNVAEGQINDILEEHPFVPENYGFILAHKNEDITQPPSRVYVSKWDPRYSLFRKASPQGFSQDPSLWTILKKEDDGTFHENEVMIPCDRIAYALFYAMRIKVSTEEVKEVLVPLQPINGPENGKSNNFFKVLFRRGSIEFTVDVESDTISDALSRAKFHIETDKSFEIEDVLPRELSIVS